MEISESLERRGGRGVAAVVLVAVGGGRVVGGGASGVRMASSILSGGQNVARGRVKNVDG